MTFEFEFKEDKIVSLIMRHIQTWLMVAAVLLSLWHGLSK